MNTLIEQTKTFFIQRAELFGSEFYLQNKLTAPVANSEISSLTEFYHQIKECQKCRLAKGRTNFVFGTGSPNAKLMCIGEAPGYEEDKVGEPFVGAAGQLLNRILEAIGFSREEVYIANVVKCRPPGNRDPQPDESAECLPYLRKQIELIQPKLILALGRIAAQNLLGTTDPLSKLRGRVHRLGEMQVMATYHPAALLRNQQWKREAWEDVKKLRRIYDDVVGDKPPIDFSKQK
jgi:DNA polymerase